MAGEGLESVISGALESAREEGILPPAVDEDATVVEEQTSDETPAAGNEEGEETPEGEVETPEGEEKPEGEIKPEAKKVEKPEGEVDKGKKPDTDPLKAEMDAAKGKDNRIPYSNVQRIVGNAVKRETGAVFEAVAEALGVDKTKITDASTLKGAFGVVTEMRERLDGFDLLEPIMVHDPDQFITFLAKTNPGYEKFLTAIEGGEVTKTGEKGDKGGEVDDDTPEPEPDITYEKDGQTYKTYSLDGMRKRDAWRDAQIEKRLEAKLGKRIEPFEKAHQKAQSAQEINDEINRDLVNLLKDAREWDGYTDHEKDIQAALKEIDSKIPMKKALRMAYERVVIGSLREKAAKARELAMKELEGAATSTSTANTGGKKTKTVVRNADGEVVDGTEAAIRASIAAARAEGRM